MITNEAQLYQDYLQAERQYSDLTVKAYLTDIEAFTTFLAENGGFTTYRAVQTLDVRVY